MEQTGFTRKKVESLTLGEKMRKLRGDFRLSLPEVSKATRIQVKYLEYLENGEYAKLPADVYVRGFLRSYARYLNIDEQAFIRLYEREQNIQANLGHEKPMDRETKNFATSSLVVTPRLLIIIMITFLVGGAFFYLYSEFKSFAAEPRLVILEPSDKAVIEASEVVVRGKTDKGARVSINNQAVFVAGEGEFSDKLLLQPGINTVTVVAVNRFDKERTEALTLEAKYSPPTPVAVAPPAEPYVLKLSARGQAVTLTVLSDGGEVFQGTLKAGESREIEAREQVVVSSDKARATWIEVAGGEPEALGESNAAVENVIFTREGRREIPKEE